MPRLLCRHTAARHAVAIALAAGLLTACTSTTRDSEVGAARKQLLLVPQQQVLSESRAYYEHKKAEASRKGTLITSGREFERLRTILNRMHPAVTTLRSDALDWPWELVLIDEPETINAHVLAGGKVTFFTGFIRKNNASDDELAAAMGHEMAHALREHTREKMSQDGVMSTVRDVGLKVLGTDAAVNDAAKRAQLLALTLPFSRAMESEADALGLELAARAGYNPRGAVTLWEKMAKHGSGGPAFLSTHPDSNDRRAALEALLPKVLPLYEQALKTPLRPSNVIPGQAASSSKSAVSATLGKQRR